MGRPRLTVAGQRRTLTDFPCDGLDRLLAAPHRQGQPSPKRVRPTILTHRHRWVASRDPLLPSMVVLRDAQLALGWGKPVRIRCCPATVARPNSRATSRNTWPRAHAHQPSRITGRELDRSGDDALLVSLMGTGRDRCSSPPLREDQAHAHHRSDSSRVHDHQASGRARRCCLGAGSGVVHRRGLGGDGWALSGGGVSGGRAAGSIPTVWGRRGRHRRGRLPG